MNLNLHFCGKKLALIQVNAEKAKSCCSTTKNADDKCCKNQQLSIKIKDNYSSVTSSKIPSVKSIQLFDTAGFDSLSLYTPSRQSYSFLVCSSPPLGENLCIKNCVFRI